MTREEALSQLQMLTLEEFSKKIENLNLPDKRIQEFYDVVTGKIAIYYSFSQFDIREFALKSIFHESYDEFKTESHPYSTCELYDFNPAKNGQNLVKHGIGFGEVVSYSKNFGSLNIPCPDSKDGKRIVSFSDLDLENNKLAFPLSAIQGTRYCISIVTNINGKFRFISSRFISSNKKKYTKTISQSLKNLDFTNEKSKTDFFDYIVQYFENNLIGHSA